MGAVGVRQPWEGADNANPALPPVQHKHFIYLLALAPDTSRAAEIQWKEWFNQALEPQPPD